MRIWTPSPTSLRNRFSQRFQNLTYVVGSGGQVSGVISVNNGLDVSGGGYVRYNSRGAGSVWNLPYWSIYLDVLVPAAGTARTILECGGSVGSLFELGIDSSNHMQLIGLTTVVSDSTLSAGRHSLLFIYTGDAVEFWADGVKIGSSVVRFRSVSPQFVYVGSDRALLRKWLSTIYRVDVYKEPIDMFFAVLPPDTYRLKPTGMTLLDISGIEASEEATNIDWTALVPTGGDRYVNVNTGSNSNDGLTSGTPWLSLYKAQSMAYADSSIHTIHVAAGTYRRPNSISTSVSSTYRPTQSMSWLATGGTVRNWNIEDQKVWTVNATYSNVWEVARSSTFQAISATETHSDGTPKKLTWQASVAACAGAVASGDVGNWYTDNVNVYVHMADGLSPMVPSERIYISLSTTQSKIYTGSGSTQSFDGFEFLDGLTIVGNGGGPNSVAVFQDCSFILGEANGLYALNLRNVYCKDCESHYNVDDGFNIHHTFAGEYCRAVFENCHSYNEGVSGSDNAFTTHDGSACLMVGCTGNTTVGPASAHIDVPQLWCVGCDMSNGTYGHYVLDGKAWLDTCTASGCSTDRRVAGTAEMYCYMFSGDSTDNVDVTATLEPYVPET